MRKRITITIDGGVLNYVDRSARKNRASRSRVIESFIEESRQTDQQDCLRRRAREFFAETKPEEVEETQDWLKMSLETLKRDD